MSSHHRNSGKRDRDRKTIARTGAGCHICGQPIDYTLRSPDPMSFEVDHVVPLSSAKTEAERDQLDQLHNKRAAHRGCNSKKRARLVAPVVRRSSSLA